MYVNDATEDKTRSGDYGAGVSDRGLLSLVYVSHLVDAAVQQSYDTNRMVANQVRFALQNALETGLKDQTVDPNDPTKLRELVAAAIRDSDVSAGNARLGQPVFADGIRREHRGYAIAHAAEHLSRQ